MWSTNQRPADGFDFFSLLRKKNTKRMKNVFCVGREKQRVGQINQSAGHYLISGLISQTIDHTDQSSDQPV